ncbi:AMP-dependent synthetase and ligase family protein [Perilla frutescens var. hirtella]|nr:AMP-dependent synthetase and ligase family protein [Perilla frutescens var. frutescens]KAH6783473.1 AMP-dependent synthetase and ligase family protein [Perilla frutescens var. hirtella]
MAALLKAHVELQSSLEEEHDGTNETLNSRNPSWYSPETGIYSSKYPSINLPSEPFLDVVSFIFSHKHNGIHALVDSASGLSVPYSKLLPLVKSMAAGLHRLGVKQGDVILILLPNSVCFPLIFLGALSIGATVTPMNPLSSLLEIKRQFLDSKATLAFAGGGKVDELVNALGGCRVVGVPDVLDFSSQPSDGCSVFHELISCDPGMAPTPRIMQQDTAAILYSSGTTGRSKGVMLTHGNFIAMIEIFVRFEASLYDYPSTENVYLAVVPMFHVYGLSLFVLGLLSLGSTVVTMKKFDADEMGRSIDRYRITHLHAVPPILVALTKRAKKVDGNSLWSLKQVSCGAAPLSEKNISELFETLPHVDFIQGYGMTESTALATRGYNTGGAHKYSSVGLLSPNVQAKVVDWATGAHLPPGSVGELWLRSPGNMKGYLDNIDATAVALDKEGWLHTGDIVYFDPEGYLYVIDRLKEMIKYKGFQIAPADLEAVLTSHPEVLDVAVTGARDEEAGEIPVAFVVPKQGSRVSEASLMDYVAKQVAPYKKVRKVYFRSSIPRSPAGKILRRELRNLLVSRL